MAEHHSAAKVEAYNSDELAVEVVERKDTPGAWAVEAINYGGDGEIYMAVFSGPGAKERAFEYAEMKYGGYRRR